MYETYNCLGFFSIAFILVVGFAHVPTPSFVASLILYHDRQNTISASKIGQESNDETGHVITNILVDG